MKARTFLEAAAVILALGVGGCAVQTSTGEEETSNVVSTTGVGARDPKASAGTADGKAVDGAESGNLAGDTFTKHANAPEPNPWIPAAAGGPGGGGGGSGGAGGAGNGGGAGGYVRDPNNL